MNIKLKLNQGKIQLNKIITKWFFFKKSKDLQQWIHGWSKVIETYWGSAILDCASFVQCMYTLAHGSYLVLHNLFCNMYINYKTEIKKNEKINKNFKGKT